VDLEKRSELAHGAGERTNGGPSGLVH
jgi:hypothetical protein